VDPEEALLALLPAPHPASIDSAIVPAKSSAKDFFIV